MRRSLGKIKVISIRADYLTELVIGSYSFYSSSCNLFIFILSLGRVLLVASKGVNYKETETS